MDILSPAISITKGGRIMISGISGSSSAFSQMQMQMQSMQQQKGQGARFSQLDTDANGGIDPTELQAMTDKIAETTGQEINVEDVTKTYDANNDGLLGRDEMKTMMMDLSSKMGGSQGGTGAKQAFASYQSDPANDPASILMDILSKSAAEQAGEQAAYSPLDIQV